MKDLVKRLQARQMQQAQRSPGARTTRVVVVADSLCQQAADEIERLTAERDTLADSCAAKADRIDRLGENVERLRAERDAAAADAERYRWLRDHAPNYWLLEWGISDAEVDRARGGQK